VRRYIRDASLFRENSAGTLGTERFVSDPKSAPASSDLAARPFSNHEVLHRSRGGFGKELQQREPGAPRRARYRFSTDVTLQILPCDDAVARITSRHDTLETTSSSKSIEREYRFHTGTFVWLGRVFHPEGYTGRTPERWETQRPRSKSNRLCRRSRSSRSGQVTEWFVRQRRPSESGCSDTL